MTDRQLNPEREVEIAEEWVRAPGPAGESAPSPDVRKTPAEPADPDSKDDESTEFDRHREAGESV